MALYEHPMELIATTLRSVAEELAADASSTDAWARAGQAVQPVRGQEPELARMVEVRDVAALRTLMEDWNSGKRPLPAQDREVLQRALKAFRKSLKVTRLDAESSIAGGPMSSGRQSNILGIQPPARYPRAVWDELVRQGRLRGGRHGLYELPPD